MHSVNIQSVLVEYTHNGKVFANSGSLVDNRFVFLTSNVLIPLLHDRKIPLGNTQIGLLNPARFFDTIPKVTVVIKNEDSTGNQYKQAVIIAAYVSGAIRKSVVKYLQDWSVDVDRRDIQLKEALPLFFIAQIDSPVIPDVNDVLNCLKKLKSQSSQVNLTVGNKVCVESAPFGNRYFLRCHSRGIVANIMGENNCFVLSDAPAAPGSEGSPVFTKFQNDEIPIGLVLSCMSWWKGEWIGLTLFVPFATIFDEILEKNGKYQEGVVNNGLLNALNHSVAQVTCGTFWGSAIFLNKENGIFLTNSHVLEGEKAPTLHWNDVDVKSRVLYKSPDNQIFDIAILSADESDLQRTRMVPISLTRNQVNVGDKVYALGFPLFPRPTKPKPTMTVGHISQVSKTMLKTSCTVLPGASGGGICKKDGNLVGLIVCNAKMEENSTAYPRVNMAVPIAAVYDVLMEFFDKKDVNLLKKLQVDGVQIVREWNFLKGRM